MAGMATIHITRSEAIRDIAALLNRVEDGTEVVIESVDAQTIVLRTAADAARFDADHNAWFRAKVQEAIDDLRPDVSHEEAQE